VIQFIASRRFPHYGIVGNEKDYRDEKWGIIEMKYFSFKAPSFGMVLRKHHGNDIYRWLVTLISDGTIFFKWLF